MENLENVKEQQQDQYDILRSRKVVIDNVSSFSCLTKT